MLHKCSLLLLWEQRAGQRPEPSCLPPNTKEQQETEAKGPAGLRDPGPQPNFPGWATLGFLGPGFPASSLFLHFEGPLSWELKPHEPFPSPSCQLYPESPECQVPSAVAEDQDFEGLSLSAGSNPEELCDFGGVISPL